MIGRHFFWRTIQTRSTCASIRINRIMDIIESSEKFGQFLKSLSIEENITGSHNTVFLDEYEVTLLGADTVTPFSDFIGSCNRPTIIVSKLGCKNSEIPDSATIDELEFVVDLSTSSDGTCKELGNPLLIISQEKTVYVGQPLANGRKYLLTQSVPFNDGRSNSLVETVTYAVDRGLSPLPLDSVRFIVSLYALNSRNAKDTFPNMWVTCERNSQKIIALGCTYDEPKSTLHVLTVKEEELVTESSISKTDQSKMATLKNAIGSVFSEYQIFGTSENEAERSSCELRIQFSWSDPNGMLCPPPESSSAVLKISTTPGGLLSPVLSMYEELQSLYRLCQISCKGLKWPLPEESEEISESSDGKIICAVEGFLEDVAHPLTLPVDATVMSPISDHIIIYEPRKNLDFLERLWVFCQNVTSFDELQLVFAEVFKAVLLGKVQPFIHRQSTSTLAGLLRKVCLSPDRVNLQDSAVNFQMLLTESKLLPCLIQLGIEKIKYDNRSFFVGADICTADIFEQFFISDSSQFEQCVELCKLHSILEADVNIMKMLNFPSSVLSTFTKTAMEVFKKDHHYQPFSRSPLFSLPLPSFSPALKTVVTLCSKLSPTKWSLTTSNEKKRDSCTYMMKKQPLFCYLHDSMKSEEYYYSYVCSYETTT